jgi:hypothetical protein
MGYTIFTVVFADGLRQACVTGNAVDFIRYPPGKSPKDVVKVLPARGQKRRFVGQSARVVLVPVFGLSRIASIVRIPVRESQVSRKSLPA